jgi:branched-chain amino acid transport system permease protein
MNKKDCQKVFWVGLLIICLSIAPIFIENEYYLHIFIIIFLNIIIATGMRLIMTTGLVSFCHAAFVAIGGYASALTVMRLGMSSWLGFIAAILISIVLAVLFGLILLRLKGTYFFIASTAFGEITLLVFTRWTNPFGGAAGLIDIPLPNSILLPGLFTIEFGSKISFFYLSLAIMLLVMLIASRIDAGRLGSIFSGIRQADELAQSVGINIMLYKTVAFAIGCGMAAFAGAFQAHYYSHIDPAGFGFFTLVNYLLFTVVGGSKKLSGPVIGATMLTFLGEFLSFYESIALYQTIIFGLVLILVILFLPDGLVSLPKKLIKFQSSILIGKFKKINSR